MQKNSNSHISFTDVDMYYPGNVPGVLDISFEVLKGEFLVFVGPSGCGKSTLLKIVAGLEVQSAGEVEKPKDISMVFQNAGLFPWLTVFENTVLGLRAQNFSEKKILEVGEKYLTMVGLLEFREKYPRDLSGGQRQRVGIARALAVEPEVLLLDEPFSALDTATTEELHNDLVRIWQHTKKTIVMVSHSLEEAVTLADRIVLMKNSRIVETFSISLPRPRRQQMHSFIEEVHKLREKFF